MAPVRAGSDPGAVAGTAAHRDAVRALKELLAKTIDFLVDERLGYTAEVVREVQLLVDGARSAITTAEIDEAANRLRHFWLRLELRGEGPEPMIRGLHELVRLMVRNMGDLVVDDQWVKGQCDRIRALLDAPLSPKALQDAQRGYREFVYRQGTLKHSMDEAASAIRELTAAVIERLGSVAASTGRFSETVARCSEQIRAADGLPQVRDALARLLDETRSVHVEMIATHEELTASREKVRHYEARVRALQAELVQMSETVIEDPLTAALNRRGLEQRFVAERARSERIGSPMCIAVLDVDNFKHLNDRLGHGAGDEALKHLAAVVRDTLRASDSLARYGGEEFVILLPDTTVEEAERVMVRVQRELTKRFFMHNHERVLITFSAGVASRRPGEGQETVIERADRAMYEAKLAGKNLVRRADTGDA
jgi:diguanylate cyclase